MKRLTEQERKEQRELMRRLGLTGYRMQVREPFLGIVEERLVYADSMETAIYSVIPDDGRLVRIETD